MRALRALLLASVIAFPMTAAAQTMETVQLDEAASSVTIEASLTGSEYRDYLVSGRVGQTLSISLETDGTAYFNLLPPGSAGEAMYNGSIDGNETREDLPVAGDYAVRVYLMGADRSEDRSVGYALTLHLE